MSMERGSGDLPRGFGIYQRNARARPFHTGESGLPNDVLGSQSIFLLKTSFGGLTRCHGFGPQHRLTASADLAVKCDLT